MNSFLLIIVFVSVMFFLLLKNNKKQKKSVSLKASVKISIKCPYCFKDVSPVPKRKKKCPHCKEPIFPVIDPEDRKTMLFVREEINEEIQKRWIEIRRIDRWHECLERYGLNMYKLSTAKGKEIVAERDIIWFGFNTLIANPKIASDLEKMINLYSEMGEFVYESGENPYEFNKKSRYFSLLMEKQSMGITKYFYKVEIKSMKFLKNTSLCDEWECCDLCSQLHGKILTIDEALKTMPIPVKECTRKKNKNDDFGICRCLYIPVLE